ncbi:MAG: amidohydrolase family protein [Candidatus Eisenbacteria bacterium]|nr:amidohydrolase family protein [Candidatus Eisenbacteria bacterium]
MTSSETNPPRRLTRVEGPILLAHGAVVPAVLTVRAGRIASIDTQNPDEVTPGSAVLHWDSGESTRLSLPGVACLPAFVDGHTHLVGHGLGRTRPRLSNARSRDEALAALEAWLRVHPGEGPVIAEGWDQSRWPDRKGLTGADLDRLGETRAIAARRVCGHIAAFNSAAVALLGTDWPGFDPALGVASEELPLALSQLWPPSDEEMDEAVLRAQDEALARGVVWVQEMGDRRGWAALRRADRSGRLRVRVSQFFRCEGREALDLVTSFAAPEDGPRLRFAGIKLFLDGSFGARTAAVREAYPSEAPGAPEAFGTLVWDDACLEEALRVCKRNGFRVAAHAIGDRALEQYLSALDRVGFPAESEPRVEHAEMLPADLYDRSVRRGLRISMQPNFTANWQGAGGLYEQVLGPDRARALNPYARVEPNRLLFGSDHMPLGPLYGVRGACEHPDPDQRLDRVAAYQAYTKGPARSVRAPFHQARIEVGEPAHLVVIGEDVLATIVDGEGVFFRRADHPRGADPGGVDRGAAD